MTKPEYLVLAASGKTGRRLVPRLRRQGEVVRPASRRSAIRFDWEDRRSWGTALAGASAVYLVAPEDPAPIRDFVQQAVAEGVRRFVVLSGRGIHLRPAAFPGMWAAEQAARESEAEWTILRSNNFLQNFDEDMWLQPIRSGLLALPTDGVPEPFVDVDDVAAVAAAALTQEGHQGRVYELSGPEALPFTDMVELIAGETGRALRYQDLTVEQYVERLRADDVPEESVRVLDGLFANFRTGSVASPTGTVREILGREPLPPRTYVQNVAATGIWN